VPAGTNVQPAPWSGRIRAAGRRLHASRSSCWRERVPRLITRPKRSQRNDGRVGETIKGLAAEIAASPSRRRSSCATLDRLGTAPPFESRRPAGVLPCDARHLGPFQRFPDRAGDPCAAGADRCRRLPRGLPLRAALSRSPSRRIRRPPARRSISPSNKPLSGPHLGFRWGRKTCCSTGRGAGPHRQGVFLGCADRRPRPDAYGDRQRAMPAIPYEIDTLFLYMANMAWNSSMNTAGTIAMLEDKDEATGEYRIPFIIYATPMPVGDGRLCRSRPARHDVSRTARLHFAARPADLSSRGPFTTRSAGRWWSPTATCAASRRADRSWRTAEACRASSTIAACPSTRIMPTTSSHERRPGIGPLAGFRGADGGNRVWARGLNPGPIEALHRERRVLFRATSRTWRQQFYKHANRAYQDFAVKMGFFDNPISPSRSSSIQRSPCRNSVSRRGPARTVPCARDASRTRIDMPIRPAARLVRGRFEEAACRPRGFPLPCDHAAADADVSLVGIDERLAAPDPHTSNRLYVPSQSAKSARAGRRRLGLDHLASRPRSRSRSRARRAVNRDTMWTWNAIGKRKGAWGLARDAPEANRGFLLNHLIHELLPPKGTACAGRIPIR
jgi:hypothetical protein